MFQIGNNADGTMLKTPLIEAIKHFKAAVGDGATNGAGLKKLIIERASATAWDAFEDRTGYSRQEVLDKLDDLEGYLIELKEFAEPILLPLSVGGEPLDLSLGVKALRPIQLGEIAFAVEAGADASVTVDNMLAAETVGKWEHPLPESHALQVFTATGRLGLKGTGAGGVGGATLTLSASTAADVRVSLFHQYSAATPTLDALMASAGAVALPWDLASMEKHLRPRTSPIKAGLRRVEIASSADFEFGGGVSVGRAVSYEKDLEVPKGVKSIGVAGTLGAQAQFSLKRRGGFEVVVERESDGILVSLNQSSSSESDRSISLAADFTISGLDEVARAYAVDFFDDPKDLLAKIDKWSRPGDLLTEKLEHQDFGDELLDQFAMLLIGEESSANLKKAMVSRLTGIIRQQLNEKVRFWGEDSEAITQSAIDGVVETLDLDSEIANALREKLAPKLNELVEKVKSELDEHIDGDVDWFEGLSDRAVSQALKPFESVGQRVAELKSEVDQSATALLDPVKQLLERYQDFRLRLLKGIEKAAQYKIGLAITDTLKKSRSRKAALIYRVLKVNSRTRAIQRTVSLGRLGSAWSEFDAAVDAGEIEVVDGLFSGFASRKHSFGIGLTFGKFKVAMTRIKATDVNIEVDPSGRVIAAEVKLDQKAISTVGYVTRSVGLVGHYELVLAAQDDEAFPEPLGVNLSYEDEVMRESEFSEFLESLSVVMTPSTIYNTKAELRKMLNFRPGQARIDLTVPIQRSSLRRLIEIPNSVVLEEAVSTLVQITLSRGPIARVVQSLANQTGQSIDGFLLSRPLQSNSLKKLMLHFSSIDSRISDTLPGNSQPRRAARYVRTLLTDARSLVDAVDAIRDVARLQEEIRLGNVTEPPQELINRLESRLVRIGKRLNDGLDNWLLVRRFISGFLTEKVPANTVALLSLISKLSGESENILPVVSTAGQSGNKVLIA